MPQDRIYNRKIGRSLPARAALGAALAAAMVCANTAAVRAGDDDEGGASLMSTIMHSLGFKSAGDTYGGIDYNERSPLVVPPTRDLPPPVNSNAAPTPNWPKDADVERRKQAKKDDKPHYQRGDSVIESSRVLRPNELDAPGAPKTNAPGDADSTANSTMTNPRDTGAKKNLFSGLFAKKEEYTTFTGEPARDALTDPPPGYLTPSPDQPYGISSAKAKYKIPTLGERMEPTR
jgi:hypothetical protein